LASHRCTTLSTPGISFLTKTPCLAGILKMHARRCLPRREDAQGICSASGWPAAAQPPGPTGRGIVAAKCRRASFGVVCGPCLHIYTLQTLPLHDTPAQAAHPGYRACVIARLVARQARVRILAAVKGQEHHEQRLLSASAHVVAYMLVGVWCQDML